VHLGDGICKYSNSLHVVARLSELNGQDILERKRGGAKGGQSGSTWLTVFVNIPIYVVWQINGQQL
jgi:hypothetical protein